MIYITGYGHLGGATGWPTGNGKNTYQAAPVPIQICWATLQAGKLGFDTAAVLRRFQRDPPRHERGGRRRGLRGVPARRQGFHTDQPLLLRQHPGTT